MVCRYSISPPECFAGSTQIGKPRFGSSTPRRAEITQARRYLNLGYMNELKVLNTLIPESMHILCK